MARHDELEFLMASGILPEINVHREYAHSGSVSEDGSWIVEWILPGVRIVLNIEDDRKQSGWHVISKQITASGPLHEVVE